MSKMKMLSKKYIKATCDGLCNAAVVKNVSRITDSESFRLGYSCGFEEGIKFAQSCKGSIEPSVSRVAEPNSVPTYTAHTYTAPMRSPGDHRPLTNEEMLQSGEFTSASDFR